MRVKYDRGFRARAGLGWSASKLETLADIKVWHCRNQNTIREVFAMASIRKRSSVILLLAGLLGVTASSSESQEPGPVTQPPPATQPVAATQPPPPFQSAPAQAAPVAAPSRADSAGVIQTQETNTQSVVADLTECKRKDGVLTVKFGFRNTSGGRVGFYTDPLADYDKLYFIADNKKYFVLTDSEKQPLWGKTEGNVSLNPGQSWHWWAKFPAPPAAVKSINLLTPVASPFDDVSVSDQ
jgi:hypothetical protein